MSGGTEGWGACTTLTVLVLPRSPGQDSLSLRLWFPVPSVPFLGAPGLALCQQHHLSPGDPVAPAPH